MEKDYKLLQLEVYPLSRGWLYERGNPFWTKTWEPNQKNIEVVRQLIHNVYSENRNKLLNMINQKICEFEFTNLPIIIELLEIKDSGNAKFEIHARRLWKLRVAYNFSLQTRQKLVNDVIKPSIKEIFGELTVTLDKKVYKLGTKVNPSHVNI